MASLLLHACCAHCAAYCVEHWQTQGLEVTAFWYNPNIHPYLEHQRRLEALQTFASEKGLPLITAEDYEMVRFFRVVVGHESERCGECFRLRLSQTAKVAQARGFSAFTTTLLISPHQKHELLRRIGERVSAETGVDFLYEDLRKQYSESRRLTKPLDLYRQQYCGCLYSEWERYRATQPHHL